MLELLFLLLPVAAAYGWYMGRRSAQQSKQDDANRLSRDYVAGVNFLLSNQQDKAVDLFLDMLKEDTGTVEAHLTLGNLFRSRGEVDRAIRIHQSLMESASLTYDQRLLATSSSWGATIWPPGCTIVRKICSNSWWMRPISA